MHLESLTLLNFKNYESVEIQLHRRVNGIYGDNGQGKTNLLDAVYYLSFCKSFFNPIDIQNIKSEEEFFLIQGFFADDEQKFMLHCGVKKGFSKVFKKNDKEYERLADHIGTVPLVMMSPADTDLIHEGSEFRRKFVDGIIAQFDRKYLEVLQQYQRILKQRNAVLKHFFENRRFDGDMLLIYNEQLAEYGNQVFEKRKEFLKSFEPLFEYYLNLLTDGSDKAELVYESQLSDNAWLEGFEQSLGKDRAIQFTTFGIHKDDLLFKLNSHPLKKFGSQGQQKTFVLALKLAQYHSIREKLGKNPILLLDDVFDKIDDKRVNRLLALINGDEFGQTFITDTEKDRLASILNRINGDYQLIGIQNGQLLT